MDSTSPTPRTDKELIDATRPFAKEDRAKSWFALLSTVALEIALVAVAVQHLPVAVRAAASIVAGLTAVRMFILYHDHLHGALLRKSFAAKCILYPYAILVMTPPRVWRETHNYHHAHTAKIVGSHVGSYAMLTTAMWQKLTPAQRLVYKAIRHPLTILFGYFTLFMYGMCVSPFLRSPRKNWDSAFALVVNWVLTALLVWRFGFDTFFFGLFLPVATASATGGYLFYAQHNFPDIHVQPRETWNYTRAALESSSYMKMGPVMRFFTGNIGYHHVHHLNAMIPFYRLPEAMAAIPELANPPTTSLAPRDVIACFRQKLWDTELGQMVGYPEAIPVAGVAQPR